MHRIIARAILLLVVVGSALTLVADTNPLRDVSHRPGAETDRILPYEPFTPCPTPPCMAPCVYGAPPEVLCQSADGSTAATTYFCCCCGGGGGSNSFKPL